MVKSVVGDETRLRLTEERLFKCSPLAEVGLVIGKLSSSLDRGFGFDLIPTPPNDAGEPPCSLISPDTTSIKKWFFFHREKFVGRIVTIDTDWVFEHARQVSPMLLGGMAMLGVYIWATENAFKASTTALWQKTPHSPKDFLFLGWQMPSFETPSDTFEILQDHCKELMFMEPPADRSKLLEPETGSITLTTKSFWDALVSSYSTSGSIPNSVTKSEKDVIQKQSSTKFVQSSSFSIVAAITVLVVAIMTGLVFFMLSQKK